MPDAKITALTSIGTSTDPANDPLVIVDVNDTSMAASGTTKKVTLNQLLATSPTATLASATITGDLTVDTSTLKVDSANDRVGIGTASPAAFKLHVNGASGNQMVLSNGGEQFTLVEYRNSTTAKAQQYWDNTNTIFENYLLSGSHAFTWKASATEWMRLNSTGLGVGRTPAAYKFEVLGNAQIIQSNFLDVALRISQGASTSGNKAQVLFTDTSGTVGNITSYGSAYGTVRNSAISIGSGTNEHLFINSSGNVGISVTPSAWGSNYTPVELTKGAAIWGAKNVPYTIVGANVYNDATNEKYVVSPNTAATKYQQTGGVHSWYNAAAGAAGTAITFTQAMTLDASGRLLVGPTSANTSGGILQLSSGITFPATQVASSDANTLDDYEEGNFTPTISGTTSAGTGTYTTQFGRYTKIGRVVTCDITVTWTAHTGTGNLEIAGLPFSVLTTTDYTASASIGYFENVALTAGNVPAFSMFWFNTTKLRGYQYPTGGGTVASIPMDSAGQMSLSITYIVA